MNIDYKQMLEGLSREEQEDILMQIAKNRYLKRKTEQQQSQKELFTTTINTLSDVVGPGSYVAYDAGVWDSESPIFDPAKKFKSLGKKEFCGWEIGYSKNEGIVDFWGNKTPNGWLAYGVEDEEYTLLAHAGIVAIFMPNGNIDEKYIEKMNNFCNENFVNPDFALDANCIEVTTFRQLASVGMLSAEIADIGANYWFANCSNGSFEYYDCSGEGRISRLTRLDKTKHIFGIRPIVRLRSDVVVTKGDGTKGNPFQIKVE